MVVVGGGGRWDSGVKWWVGMMVMVWLGVGVGVGMGVEERVMVEG